MSNQQLIVYGVVAVLVVGLLAFRMRRMMQSTPFNPTLAWIAPAIFLALSGLLLFAAKPAGSEWAWIAGFFAVGGVLGYFRGKSISMGVDPATGRIMAQGSATAMIFIVILLVARFALSFWLRNNPGSVGLSPMMANVLPAVMGSGLFVMRGYEMGTRGMRLLQAARSTPVAAITDAP